MKIVVLKFGGTSLGSINKIKNVAKIIVTYLKKRNKVIVVCSAMSGQTNRLIKLTRQISTNFDKSEYDAVVATGEQVSCSLLAARMTDIGYLSRSWLGWQIPIITQGLHSHSRIIKINQKNILKFLKKGGVPIISGFQGINIENRITTIGRGGSDASAIMLAKFFNANRCIIYTDVDGVYTTDPKVVPKAKKIKKISYEEMLEMASLGAKVMQPDSIQDARMNRIDIEVRSTFKNVPGSLITKKKNISTKNIIRGVSFTKNDSKITLVGVKDRPGVAAAIFEPLFKNSINVDMVVQNISSSKKETDLTFTIKNDDLLKTRRLINKNKRIKFRKLLIDEKVSKVSIVGVGMITTPGVTFRMFNALAKKNINILVISTSEIKISVLVDRKNLKKSVDVLHKEFKLDY
ncbi:aspartate kinase [Candidatus Pelagibacter sp.]|nr:aspartate kinase [Candidatus Pelagibacter sp.]